MALQLRRKTHESIVYIDKDSAPRIMPNGEDFILEDIPIGNLPLYNYELEGDFPAPAKAFKDQIAALDAPNRGTCPLLSTQP